MEVNIKPIGALITEFSRLPGVGQKTAQRYAYSVIDMTDEQAQAFAEAIINAKNNVHYCKVCGNFCEGEICDICANRSSDTVCVVKDAKDVIAIEKTHGYNGLYHVLGGVISPLNHVFPNDLKIKELLKRIGDGNVKEVIIATNPDVEGEATAMYLSNLLKPLGVTVSRLARGISTGTELEYADGETLSRAIAERRTL